MLVVRCALLWLGVWLVALGVTDPNGPWWSALGVSLGAVVLATYVVLGGR